MPVKIRLQRKGRRKKPFYHIVIADGRAPRDGRFIEQIGSYNPMTSPATIEIDSDKALDWLEKGAQPTDTARAILRFKGVLYRKHLNRGVKKGAFSQEQADKMYADFMTEKNDRVAKRIEQSRQDEIARMAAISGTAKALEVEEEVVEEAVEAAAEEAAPAVEEAAAEAEAVVEEAAPAVEAVAEEAAAATEEVAEAATEAVEEAAADATEDTPAE